MRRPTKKQVLKAIGYTGAAVVVAAVVAANAAMLLFGDTIDAYLGADSVEISDEQKSAVMDDGRNLARRIEGEGLVLLRNEDDALPLPATTTKVNVFGWASTQWVASGSGSGQVSGTTKGFLDALKDNGIEYNEQLAGMYRDFHGERAYKSAGALSSRSTEFCRLYEPSVYDKNCYTDDLLSNAEEYSDTAIVVVGRTAGESIDCPGKQYKICARGGDVTMDATRGYLELSSEEIALLRYVGSHYEHTIVVVNSTNTMELGELETIPGIDAALLAGPTGEVGADAVVAALKGEINPSGRTTDTFAYDFSTAASWANSGAMGEGLYTNRRGLYPADGTKNPNIGADEEYDSLRFVDYVEGIYVGYRWYETADAEGYWNGVSNRFGQGYDGVVQYPFGYGLSYTSFSWEVTSRTPGQGFGVSRDSVYTTTVRVTNTGERAGRDVVQLYCTPPYTKGGVEKASTVLVAYAKTKLLEPGESQEVELSFTLDDVASYDAYDKNGDGFNGYELDAGAYTVELKRNAHELADCDFARTQLNLRNTVQCGEDLRTGSTVANRFTGDSTADGVSIDGSNSGASITWLTRADFAGTFPAKCDPDRQIADNVAALNLYGEQDVEADAADYQGLIGQGAYFDGRGSGNKAAHQLTDDGELTEFARALGENYNDEGWDALLDDLSVDQMTKLVLHGYISTSSIDDVGKPLTKEVDGPSQVGSFNQLAMGVGYPSGTVIAQTWNDGLALEYGRQLGREAAAIGVDGLYAPSVNIHRTPLGGRNYEYFSEDPLVAGNLAAAVVAGAKQTGTYCYIKHLALNNQDSYRDSLYEWLTEQTLREIYLRPFKLAIEKGGATGLMSAYNRIGATWAGGNKALLTGVLREEWGFEGAVITDYADHQQYMNADQMLRAGGDLFMDGVFRNGQFKYGFSAEELSAASGSANEARALSFYTNLRRATKDVLYVWLNARVSQDSGYVRPAKKTGVSWVRVCVAAADIVVLAGAATLIARRRSRARA